MAVEESNFPYNLTNRLPKSKTMSQSLPTGGFHYNYFGSSLSSSMFLDLTSTTAHVKPDPGFVNYLTKKSPHPYRLDISPPHNRKDSTTFNQFTSWTQPLYLEENICSEELAEYSNAFAHFTFLFDQVTEDIVASITKRIKALSGNVESSLNDKVTHIVTARSAQEVKSFVNGSDSSESLLQGLNKNFRKEITGTQILLHRLQKQGVKLWSLDKINRVLDQLTALSMDQPTKSQSDASVPQAEAEPVYFNDLFLLVEDTTSIYCPIMADEIIVPADLGSRSPVWDYVIRENPEWTHLLPEDSPQVKKKTKGPRKHKNGKVAPGKLLKLIKPKKKAPVVKKAKRGYCENCNVLFECMETHLQETVHQQLSRDYSRYDELDDIISGVKRIGIS